MSSPPSLTLAASSVSLRSSTAPDTWMRAVCGGRYLPDPVPVSGQAGLRTNVSRGRHAVFVRRHLSNDDGDAHRRITAASRRLSPSPPLNGTAADRPPRASPSQPWSCTTAACWFHRHATPDGGGGSDGRFPLAAGSRSLSAAGVGLGARGSTRPVGRRVRPRSTRRSKDEPARPVLERGTARCRGPSDGPRQPPRTDSQQEPASPSIRTARSRLVVTGRPTTNVKERL